MGSTITAPGDAHRRRSLNNVLWAMQVFLFLTFGALGIMKLTMPVAKLTNLLTWPGMVPEVLVRCIGAVEVAGAMGVLLPGLTRMRPWITSYAAMGLTTVMICAVGYHLMLFQGKAMVPCIILGIIAGYVA